MTDADALDRIDRLRAVVADLHEVGHAGCEGNCSGKQRNDKVDKALTLIDAVRDGLAKIDAGDVALEALRALAEWCVRPECQRLARLRFSWSDRRMLVCREHEADARRAAANDGTSDRTDNPSVEGWHQHPLVDRHAALIEPSGKATTEAAAVTDASTDRSRIGFSLFSIPRVVVESPYAGDVERNLRYLRAALRDCLLRGEAPYASHAIYTQPGVLDDDIPSERTRGIHAGLAWGLAPIRPSSTLTSASRPV